MDLPINFSYVNASSSSLYIPADMEVFSLHFSVLSVLFRMPPMCAGKRIRYVKFLIRTELAYVYSVKH